MNVIVKDLRGQTIPDLKQESFIVTDMARPLNWATLRRQQSRSICSCYSMSAPA